jgi:hypothetical protein
VREVAVVWSRERIERAGAELLRGSGARHDRGEQADECAE